MILMVLALLIRQEAGAQNKPGKKRAKGKPVQREKTKTKKPSAGTVKPLKPPVQKADSQKIASPAQPLLPDSAQTDSSAAATEPGKSDLDDEVKYTAEDSVIYDAAASKVYLYHNARVDYTNLTLTAEYIEIDLKKSLAFARGKEDTTGKLLGKPVFTQGSDKYAANAMTYNFKSKRAKIQGIVTQQGEGYIHGESVKKTPENEMYIRDAQYTTCNLEHPHFHIQASKIKLIPNKKLVSGPFNLHFMDVPTPFGFGLGIFPTPQTATSGIIVPTYGEALDRGFFLRNGGYYWHVNDYVDTRFLGDIYSKGSYGFSVIANYKKRYSLSGNVDLRYNKRIAGDDNLSPVGEDFWINWNHNPETRGSSSFSASVNLGTSTFNERNSFSTNNYLSSTFSSNVSYSKTFRGTPFNMAINARQQQNVVSKQIDLDLPTFNLNMNRIFPFKRASSSGKTWYEKIGVAYTMALQNSLTNKFSKSAFLAKPDKPDTILAFEQRNLNTLFRGMRNGMRHSIPVSTSFNVLKYLQVAPGFNYDEVWYLQRLDYNWDPTRKALITDTLRQFSRAYNFNTSVSFQTRVYGIFFIRKAGIEAIRHIMNPTIGLSYRPDLSDPRFGMMKEVQVNESGKTEKRSPFANGIFGGTPTIGKTAALSFALNNTFEMKVKNRKDSSGKEPFKKINLLDNVNLSSSYNLAADSFQLAPVTFSARTTLFEKLNINMSGTLDPYAYRAPVLDANGKTLVAQRKTPTYTWNAGRGIGQISSFNIALSTSLNPKARDKKVLPRKALNPQTERELEFINNNPDLYVDFNIPWNLSISYNFTYNKTGFDKAALVQSMTFSGDLNLTPKWKVGFNSGYDFINKTLVYPNINIYRDLHCWEMRFNWIPTGTRGSYSIDINVKASVLQDLKLSRRRSWFDR
jgi:hypothetical protein